MCLLGRGGAGASLPTGRFYVYIVHYWSANLYVYIVHDKP